MIEAVLFDLGDTLYRFESNDPRFYFDRGVAMAHACLRNHEIPVPDLAEYSRRVLRRMMLAFVWSRIRRREIRPLQTLQRIHRRMGIHIDLATTDLLARQYFEPMRLSGRLDPDAPSVLAELRRAGCRLGIVSNTFTPPSANDDQLRSDGIFDYFPVRIYSCQTGYMKPHPAIFRTALDAMGVPAGRSMYVGDKPRLDVVGARRVGMITVLKLGDRTPRRIRPRPDHAITRLTELPAILQNHASEA
jgi:putative hydrolase of the HAD superfamily